jgi:excisionase family DNA binding protein
MDTIQGNVTGRMGLALLPPSIALAYRVNYAVRISGLSRPSLYALIAEQKLKSIKVGGRRLIPAAALRDLLQGAA